MAFDQQHEPSNGEQRPYHDELVAYLDGELDTADERRVENLLASNPAIRNELRRLEQTWDLLDELPRATVDESFGSSTAEMVAIAAEEELESERAEVPRRQLLRWSWAAAGLATALACGFLGMRLLLPDPNAQLLADLPILENLDAYRQAGDVEFLRMLSTDRLIPVPVADPAGQAVKAPGGLNESMLERRERVESLVAQEKDQLERKAQRFIDLPQDEQRQLRDLHAAIQQHPQRDELYRVMFSYYDWLKTLSAGEPTDLHQLGPKDRLAKIKQIEGRRLTDEDRKAIEEWASALVKARPIDMRMGGGPPRDPRDQRPPGGPGGGPGGPGGGPGGPGGGPGGPGGDDPPFWLFRVVHAFEEKKTPPLSKAELHELAEELSTPRGTYLVGLTIPEQRLQVEEWLRAVPRHYFSRPMLTEEQIRQELSKLPPGEQTALLKLPHAEVERRLRERMFGGGGPNRFGGPGRGGDGRGGDGRGRGGPGGGFPEEFRRGGPDRDGKGPPFDRDGFDGKRGDRGGKDGD